MPLCNFPVLAGCKELKPQCQHKINWKEKLKVLASHLLSALPCLSVVQRFLLAFLQSLAVIVILEGFYLAFHTESWLLFSGCLFRYLYDTQHHIVWSSAGAKQASSICKSLKRSSWSLWLQVEKEMGTEHLSCWWRCRILCLLVGDSEHECQLQTPVLYDAQTELEVGLHCLSGQAAGSDLLPPSWGDLL